MAETVTAHYAWTKPDPGASASTWGTTLNQTVDKIDAQVFTNAQAGVPIGAITMFGGATAPANWLLCQGQSLSTTGTYAALFGVLGYAFGGSGANFNLPNLTQRFPLGAGTAAVGNFGGSFSYTIGVANLPPHAHTITDVAHAHTITDVAHTHGASQPVHNHGDYGHTHPDAGSSQDAHSHGIPDTVLLGPGAGAAAGAGATIAAGRRTDSQQPAVHVNVGAGYANLAPAQPAITLSASYTGLSSVNVSGTGLSITNNAGSGTPMSIAPQWVALNYIVRYQ